jgi:hypothetical protein
MSTRLKHQPTAVSPAIPPSTPALIGGKLASKTRVFISYRHQDTAAAAAHLHASLALRFGSDSVFRDVATIKGGQDFPSVIDQAIRATSVLVALIGRRWLTVRRDGRRRLDDPKDYVRLEIESALRHGVNVIPVFMDGAKKFSREELPHPIAKLATLHAEDLPWHEGIAKLGRRISEIERERAERDAEESERVDLTRGRGSATAPWRSQSASASFNVVTAAMEMSFFKQYRRSVLLDPNDLAASMRQLTGRPMEQGFVFSDLVHVIDFVGVKAKRSNDRYVARSYPLTSFDDLRRHLKLDRPVLAGVQVFESWFREPASKTGIIDPSKPGNLQGGIIGTLVGWEPRTKRFKLNTPWPTWGRRGVAWLNPEAAEQSISHTEIRSIEVVLMSRPFSMDAFPGGEKPRRKHSQKKKS